MQEICLDTALGPGDTLSKVVIVRRQHDNFSQKSWIMEKRFIEKLKESEIR